MLSRVLLPGFGLILFMLLFLVGSAAAQDVDPRCEAAVDRAAGHYSKCLLSADASYARHENATKLEAHQERCETRFDRRTSRAIARHGADECPSSDLVAAIGDRTITYTEGVATEAKGLPAPSVLFVQNGTGGTLSETTLTLTGVNSQTGWFTDRPHRKAGQLTTEEFLSLWDEEMNLFAENPPNGDFTCEVEGEVVNYALALLSPSVAGDALSYSVNLLGDESLADTLSCSGNAHLFVGASMQMEGLGTSSDSGYYDHIWYQICFMVGDENCENLPPDAPAP